VRERTDAYIVSQLTFIVTTLVSLLCYKFYGPFGGSVLIAEIMVFTGAHYAWRTQIGFKLLASDCTSLPLLGGGVQGRSCGEVGGATGFRGGLKLMKVGARKNADVRERWRVTERPRLKSTLKLERVECRR
jgi:hypothetical protein